MRLNAPHTRGMRLIERESQLAALHEYAKEAGRGQGRLVLISGEAGVGKSVLLEEFAQESDEVLAGSGQAVMVSLRLPRSGRCSTSPAS